jgi:hypothetical protein
MDLENTPDFRSVRWEGHDFTFTTFQAAVVKLLVEHRGRPLSQAHVLETIGSAADRLRDVFKSKGKTHAAWGTLILVPAQHRRGKDLYMVPDAGSAAAPPPVADDKDATDRSDETNNAVTMEFSQLLYDLGERNHVSVLVRFAKLAQRRTELVEIAKKLEAEPLVKGIEDGIEHASGTHFESLHELETWFDGLANAWAPLSVQDGEVRARLSRIPPERLAVTCAPEHLPSGELAERRQVLARMGGLNAELESADAASRSAALNLNHLDAGEAREIISEMKAASSPGSRALAFVENWEKLLDAKGEPGE